ncbi:cytochrome c [Dictyostelium discoideum AX4]|uniref:Cytochrome c n=1 Tax=Dictyostelium discoideum TaxID=44689 RepID=CYC_DICDI|nr:cytochrome c [Dictyostelium discoideum AX4]Q869N1.1 RecName: Full=Cytochrome c [Dictyostelium discoideum]EAL69519.1 cytochrome c [Dictyostelium discoideum AX4]|eukprot:XP_643492.1 cytochrome c [Dictyostelium discoideum AX4]
MSDIIARGNVENGDKLFKARCAQCHTTANGAPNKQGPNLYGLFFPKSRSFPGYAYSDPNKNTGKFCIMWGEQTLFDYLENPKKYIPKTKMAFAGFKSEQDRADVVAYLEQSTK